MNYRYFLATDSYPRQIVRVKDLFSCFAEIRDYVSMDFKEIKLSDIAEKRIKIHLESGWWQEIDKEEAALLI